MCSMAGHNPSNEQRQELSPNVGPLPINPDGTVLIVGGVDGPGGLEGTVERFTPQTMAFAMVDGSGLTPRAQHTATLLRVGESNAVFLRGVGGDEATEPHETGCRGHPEEEVSGTHMDLNASIFKPGETIRCGSARRRRRSVDCQNWASSSCRLWRAGATGGARDGRPRESRILRATTGSSMAARIRIRERQRDTPKHSTQTRAPSTVAHV